MNLKQKINDLIREYRNQSEGLAQKEKEESGFIKFEPPLQAELIWIERRKHDIDFQILVFTHFPEIEDLDIQIHGPLKFKDRKNLIQKLDEIVHTDKWAKKKFPHTIKVLKSEPDELPYSKIYENIIADAKETFLRFLNDYVLTDRFEFPDIFLRKRYSKDVFYWIIFGNIVDLNIKEYVKNEIIKYQKGKEQEKELDKLIESPQIQKKIEEQQKHEIKGFGTYFYPPIWIGEYPQQSIEDKLTGQTVRSYVKNIIRTTYRGRTLIIQKDGYLALGESNEATAIDLMNEIMGTALLNDIGVYVIRKSEIGRVTIDSRTWNFTLYSTPPNSKHQILERERRKGYKSRDKIMRTPVTIEKVENIIKTAKKVTKNKEIRTYLSLYLEAFTFFYNAAYTQSFLMSWFIFEKLLKSRCEELQNQKSLAKKVKEFLDNNSWTPDTWIKALFIAEKINRTEYEYFMSLKAHRNCIIHENTQSNYDEADKFRRFCLVKIKKMINNII